MRVLGAAALLMGLMVLCGWMVEATPLLRHASDLDGAKANTALRLVLAAGAGVICLLAAVCYVLQREIGERKRMDAALLEEKLFSDAIIATLPGPFYLVDRQSNFVRVNRAMEQVTGLGAERLVGTAALSVVHPEDRARLAERIAEVFNKGYSEDEGRILGADGQTRNFFFTGKRLDLGGEPFLVGSGVDITELKLAEGLLARSNEELERQIRERTAELREANERLKKVMEVETVGVMVWNLNHGVLMDANEAFLKIMGYSRREVEAGELTWRKLTPPEYHEMSLAELEEFRKTGRVGPYEKEYIRKDGSRRWFVFAGSSYGKDTCVEFCVDISDRKQAEARLRLQSDALQAAANAILICDRDTTVRWVNHAFTALTGYSAEEVIGKSARVLEPGRQDEARYKQMWETILAGNVWRGEIINARKDGTLFVEEVSITPVRARDGSGEITHFIAIKQDVTQAKETERRMQRSQRLESLGTLAGGIAHDMNNMLAPILLSIDTLRYKYPEDSATLNVIQGSAECAASMVRQLLTFAKGAEGARVSLQVAHLLKEIQGIVQSSFPKNIQLELQIEPNLPCVLGDATQLHQVLLNLCVNARDAMPNGGRLTLEARQRVLDSVSTASVGKGKPGKYVVMRVLDTGTGIAPEVLDRIFEPFFTTKGPEKGTGLGLSNVIGIVKGHDGFIQVYSELGKGTAFSVYLPIESGVHASVAQAKPMSRFRGHGETILLVDDEAGVREVGKAVLLKLNFLPLAAGDGAEGIAVAAEHRADLKAAILDMQMPHMDGLALVRALRRMEPDLPIIAMSGRFDDATLAELQELGVTAYLPKPFTEGQLVGELERIFGSAGRSS